MMNKVLRDRETQLKGTDLFCNLLVTRAFRLSHFEAPEGHRAKNRCLHLLSRQASAKTAEVPPIPFLFLSFVFLFCAASPGRVQIETSIAVSEPVLCQTLLFVRGLQRLRRSGTKTPVVVTGQPA